MGFLGYPNSCSVRVLETILLLQKYGRVFVRGGQYVDCDSEKILACLRCLKRRPPAAQYLEAWDMWARMKNWTGSPAEAEFLSKAYLAVSFGRLNA